MAIKKQSKPVRKVSGGSQVEKKLRVELQKARNVEKRLNKQCRDAKKQVQVAKRQMQSMQKSFNSKVKTFEAKIKQMKQDQVKQQKQSSNRDKVIKAAVRKIVVQFNKPSSSVSRSVKKAGSLKRSTGGRKVVAKRRTASRSSSAKSRRGRRAA